MRRAARTSVASLLCVAALASCTGLSSELSGPEPEGREVAILPLAGSLAYEDLAFCRARLASLLRVRGLTVLDLAWFDRWLSRAGLLTDPEAFDPSAVDPVELCAALGLDGLIVGEGFETSSVNFLLLARSGVGGELRWLRADGTRYWRARHFAAKTGGLALGSGQVLTAIGEQIDFGTSAAFVERVETYLDEVLATLPELEPRPVPLGDDPWIERVRSARVALASGERASVEVRASEGLDLRVDFDEVASGVPAVELRPGAYRALSPFARASGAPGAARPSASGRDRFGRVVRRAAPPASRPTTGRE